jgi:hypothetical protein
VWVLAMVLWMVTALLMVTALWMELGWAPLLALREAMRSELALEGATATELSLELVLMLALSKV